jgi:hypothetical protein
MRRKAGLGWSTVLVTALGSWGKPVLCGYRHKRRRASLGWSTVLITALGSVLRRLVPRGHGRSVIILLGNDDSFHRVVNFKCVRSAFFRLPAYFTDHRNSDLWTFQSSDTIGRCHPDPPCGRGLTYFCRYRVRLDSKSPQIYLRKDPDPNRTCRHLIVLFYFYIIMCFTILYYTILQYTTVHTGSTGCGRLRCHE